MGEIAADADAFAHRVAGGAGGARLGVAEADLRMDEVADRLRAPPAARYRVELRPREIGEIVAVAIAARNQVQQHFVGKPGDRRQLGIGGDFVGQAGIVNPEAIVKSNEAGGNLDARDAIAIMIEIGAHGVRWVGIDDVGRAQVADARGMDVELQQHRRLRRALKSDVEARFDQHLTTPVSALSPRLRTLTETTIPSSCALSP